MDKIVSFVRNNKKIVALILAILLVLIIFKVAINEVKEANNKSNRVNISEIVKNKETKIIYVGSRDYKKCKECNNVVKYLNNEGIKFVTYEVEDYSKDEYESMLKSIQINPVDFGYPAVIYIKDGNLYSNVINITNIDSVKTFIKDYELKPTKTKKK